MSASAYSSQALKKSAASFLAGKLTSSLLTLLIVLLSVRMLAIDQYGAYVTLASGLELSLTVFSFGLPWIALRYLPEYRLHASNRQLTGFAKQLLLRYILFNLVGAATLYAAAPSLLELLDLGRYTDSARVYLLVFYAESIRRNVQESILEPLLQQGYAQISQVTRTLGFFLLLSAVPILQAQADLDSVIACELAASVLGSAIAVAGLLRFLATLRPNAAAADWRAPGWRDMWRTANHMYFSHFISLCHSRQAFIFLTQRYVGVEATALMGFLLNLYAQIARYLPATLLMSLIRPKLIASYLGAGGMRQLSDNANLAGKLSLFALMPVLSIAWLCGDELIALLSAGKFAHAGLYLSCILLTLLPLSQRQILETVVMACNKSQVCSVGSSLSLLSLPLALALLLWQHWGLWGLIAAMFFGDAVFNAAIVAYLSATSAYRPDSAGLLKLLAAMLFAALLCLPLKLDWRIAQGYVEQLTALWRQGGDAPTLVAQAVSAIPAQILKPLAGWLELALAAALNGGIFLLLAFFIKPFREDERQKINRMANRKIFVW